MNEKAPLKKKTTSRRSQATRLLAIRRTAEAAIQHGDQLPGIQGMKDRGKSLLSATEALQKLEDEQEALKRQLSTLTAKITEQIKACEAERTKLIKLAEGSLKKADPILVDFKARA